ncbi:50S ribosomal protein L24 [Candidatus Parcubacteria bacterium]|nr:MAG: 50S ribosomal protein L24 [Candidatus Parcubacteria bacterium]
MKIKKGDKIKILTGKDKGKSGKVLQVFNDGKKVSVEGLNLSYKHLRPRKQRESGQRIQFPAPIMVSNVQLICPKCSRPTRVGHKIVVSENKSENRKSRQKFRVCRKCKEVI